MRMQVVLGLSHQITVNLSADVKNHKEKYIQIVAMNNHEFWYIGFVSHERAFKNLREALQHTDTNRSHVNS